MGLVVAVLPVGEGDLGFDEVIELVQVQALVAAAVVERLDESVVPGLARGDVVHPDPVLAEVLERSADEFGTVVGADHPRGATGVDDVLEGCGEVGAGDGPGCDVEQGFPGVFVDHGRDLEHPPVAGGIELEVDGPNDVGGVGFSDGCGRGPVAFADFPGRNP